MLKEVRWFAIDELPTHKKDNKTKQSIGYGPNAFFMVFPFVKGLKQWMSNNQGKQVHREPTLTPSASYPIMPITKKSPSNAQSNKDEQRKAKQMQHFNKQIKDEYDDLINMKDKKYQKVSQFGSITNSIQNNNINPHLNSRFKPVKQIKQPVHQVQASNTPGVLNIIQPSSAASTVPNRPKTNVISKSVDLNSSRSVVQQPQNINSRVKKQLDFYGPECWLFFKFNYDQLLNELPLIG